MRPRKCKRISGMPTNKKFGPIKCNCNCVDTIILTLVEFETINLIDFFGHTQLECAQKMGVARTTVQSIYASARKKIADALVNGKSIEIEGGDYYM